MSNITLNILDLLSKREVLAQNLERAKNGSYAEKLRAKSDYEKNTAAIVELLKLLKSTSSIPSNERVMVKEKVLRFGTP